MLTFLICVLVPNIVASTTLISTFNRTQWTLLGAGTHTSGHGKGVQGGDVQGHAASKGQAGARSVQLHLESFTFAGL